jgi:hypothetical protein
MIRASRASVTARPWSALAFRASVFASFQAFRNSTRACSTGSAAGRRRGSRGLKSHHQDGRQELMHYVFLRSLRC